MPNFNFEFVEIPDSEPIHTQLTDEHQGLKGVKGTNLEQSNHLSDEEFDFPLFAAPKTTTSADQDGNDDEERGRVKAKTMKVSLREASVEVIKNERPISYYVASYTDEEKSKFFAAAITSDQIYQLVEVNKPVIDRKPWKCIDLNEYNRKIENELNKEKIKNKSRNRAGKKKRQSKIESRERKQERNIIQKKLEKEQAAKLKKKMHHKRGGKKHKKVSKPTDTKPKLKSA